MTLVLDAGALLEVLPERPASARIQSVLSAIFLREHVQAPAMLAWEAGNALCGPTSRLGSATPDERAATLVAMLANIELVGPHTESLLTTARFSVAHRLTFYDAAYVELASREPGTLLLTQDVALAKAARLVLGADRVLDLNEAQRRFLPARGS